MSYPQASPNGQSYTNGNNTPKGYLQQITPDGRPIPNQYYKQEVVDEQVPPNSTHQSISSPGSPLTVENLKLNTHQQVDQKGSPVVSVKKEDYGNASPQQQQQPGGQYTDQDINQQQKVMQQQYLQRVRQAQLQQQLRQIQTEYENSLQVEHDIAFEFLREQELKGETYQQTNSSSSTAGAGQPQKGYQQQQQFDSQSQGIPTLQHAGAYHPTQQQQPQQYQQLPSQQQQSPQQRAYAQQQHQQRQYVTPQGMPSQMVPNQSPQHLQQQQQQQHRLPYNGKDIPGYPAGGLPINQAGMYPGQQQRMPYPQQQQHQKGSQPIVIMPNGGGISNPGQFIPTQQGGIGHQRTTGKPPTGSSTPSTTTSPSSGGKQQTPFQKLRKIAEEISSFVDDVVKFTGKKGLCDMTVLKFLGLFWLNLKVFFFETRSYHFSSVRELY